MNYASQTNQLYYWPPMVWPQWQSPGPTLWQWNYSTTNWDVTTNATALNSDLEGKHCDVNWVLPWYYLGSERRTEDAEYKLATGGPLSSTNLNLWVLSATARTYTNTFDTVGMAVPPNQIALGKFGNLDTNGNLYVVLPDNDPDDITPHVPGKDIYSFTSPTAQEYKLRIYFNGTDVTDTNVTAFVGQKISLTCALVGPTNSTPPPITNFAWTIPGYAISNFYVSQDASQTNGFSIPLTATNANAAYYYWVDGGKKQVQCTVGTVGQTHTAKTSFTVKKPSAQLSAVISGTVKVFQNKLIFGDIFPGIEFFKSNLDTNGEWKMVQLGSQLFRYQNLADAKWARGEGSGLDTAYPYPVEDETDSPHTTLDSTFSQVTGSGSFTMYLTFKPNQADAIRLPIRKINWSWSGTATNANGIWSGSGTNYADLNDSSAPSTISWTNNIFNTLTNIQLEP